MDRGMQFCRFAAFAVLVTAAQSAFAWSGPVIISGDGNTGCSVPAIAVGASGEIHVAFRRKNPDWRILYRGCSADGHWGPVEIVGVPWSERPDIIEHPAGGPLMFYAGSGVGDRLDLFEARKSGASWTVSQFTATPDYHEDYPRLAKDTSGRVHLVHTRSSDGDRGDVIYRVWNGSWSSGFVLGSINNKNYYHRPDIAVDSLGRVHVVWAENQYSVVYRRLDGSSWSAKVVIGSTTQFFAYPKIGAAGQNGLMMVTFDQLTEAALKFAASANGGATWTSLQYLSDGHYPNLDTGPDGNAHMVYQWRPGSRSIGHRKWSASGWTSAEHSSPDSQWQGWPDVAADAGGAAHCVFDLDSDYIAYVSSAPDTTAPLPVSQFHASASDSTVYLSWTNPPDPDFARTVVRVRTDTYPSGPADGSLVCNRLAAPGSADAFAHSGLTNGLTYYYSAYACDAAGNYSAPSSARAAPFNTTCANARRLDDNTPVALNSKIVSANFAATDGCIYVQEPEGQSGIRVVSTDTGLAPGDVVNVSGTVTTRVISGKPAERQISGAVVTKVSTGASPRPRALTCRAIGGGPDGPAPGVRNSVGINTIGLLVTIAGRVTYRAGAYVFVDDGSRVVNLYGVSTGVVGVMIKCPSSSIPVAVGDAVTVTGVPQGSIPNSAEWTTNRAYMQIRDWADLRLVRGP